MRGATLTVYSPMRTNFQILVAYTMCTHWSSVHMAEYITRAEEECDFLWSREGENPSWINPCLRVLVPSPVGLDLTHSYFFSAPLHFEWTQQQVPRLSAAPFSGLKMNFGVISNRNYIFLHCLIMSLFSSMLSLYFAFHFFTGNCCCCILWEWGIFFTWVSVEKGGQSIKFKLLKTIATSSSAVVCLLINCWIFT